MTAYTKINNTTKNATDMAEPDFGFRHALKKIQPITLLQKA
jgi:hypothetical protein